MNNSSDTSNEIFVALDSEDTGFESEKFTIEQWLESIPQAVAAIKNSKELVYANSNFVSFCGYSLAQLKALQIDKLFCVGEELHSLLDRSIQSIWFKKNNEIRELVIAQMSSKKILGKKNLQLLMIFPVSAEGLGSYFIESIISDGTWSWDIARSKIWRSARWLEICDQIGAPELMNADQVSPLFEMINASKSRKDLSESGNIESLLEGEGLLRNLDGPRKHISWLGRVVEFDSDNKPLKAMGSLRDMTLFLKRNEPIIQAREMVMHHARLLQLGESLATVSHELNQPLSAIASYASVCKKMLSNHTEASDLINLIEMQSLRAGGLLRRIRNYAQREINERSPQTLIPIVNDVIEWMRTDSRCRDINLLFSTTLLLQEEQLLINCERIEIEQVLINLITNASTAIKHEKRRSLRSIEIILRTSSEPNLIELVVADRGPGLPLAIRDTAFDPFVSGHANGLGLGLSISHTIASELGGSLSYEPRTGGGSLFILSLPLVLGGQ